MRTLTIITYIVLVLALALAGIGLLDVDLFARRAVRTGQAVCGSDASCAAWEALNRVAPSERCYGAPCPKEAR